MKHPNSPSQNPELERRTNAFYRGLADAEEWLKGMAPAEILEDGAIRNLCADTCPSHIEWAEWIEDHLYPLVAAELSRWHERQK